MVFGRPFDFHRAMDQLIQDASSRLTIVAACTKKLHDEITEIIEIEQI